MENEKTIRANVRAVRMEKGLSQSKLAELAGFGQTDISKIENGTAKVTFEKLARIAHALGESMDRLLTKKAASTSENSPFVALPPLTLDNQPVLVSGLRPLPVRGIAQGGEGKVFMLPEGSPPVDMTPRPASLANVQDAYALFVFDDSMHPMYKHGWTVWVHPQQPPAPGDGVVIVKKDGETIVKELVRRTDKLVRVKRYRPSESEFDIPKADIVFIHRIVGCLQGR